MSASKIEMIPVALLTANFHKSPRPVEAFHPSNNPELLDSLAEHGYMESKPMRVKLREDWHDYLVVEGLLRLAMVRHHNESLLCCGLNEGFITEIPCIVEA